MNPKKLTRRTFLAATSAAVLTGCATAKQPVKKHSVHGANDRVNLVQIGSGSRGGVHLGSYLRIDNAQVVGVCDCFQSRREGLTEQANKFYADKSGTASYNGVTAYRDFREVLARDDVDAVSIATPDHWHVPIAIAAVKAGKDVYVEKPLSVSVAWNQAMREIVNKKKAVFQYGTQQRSDSHFRFACELARSGYIGKLERIDAWCPAIPADYKGVDIEGYPSDTEMPVPDDLDYDLWLGPAPKAPYTDVRCTNFGAWHIYDYALGFIAGWGAHPLDIAQWGNNSDDTAPIHYEGTGTLPENSLFNTVGTWDIHCTYANGVKMHFMDEHTAAPVISGYRPPENHGTTFFGSEGWVSVNRGGGIFASDPKLLEITLKDDDVHLYESANQFGNFVDCVKSRKETINPIESAVQGDLISHLSNACVRTGRSIQWDPAKEKIIGNPEATAMLDRPLRAPWEI